MYALIGTASKSCPSCSYAVNMFNVAKATHKLFLITDGPYEITSMDDTTVAVKISTHIERVLLNRVVTSPVSETVIPCLVNDIASHHRNYDLPPPIL